jgi:hypothetical protein
MKERGKDVLARKYREEMGWNKREGMPEMR